MLVAVNGTPYSFQFIWIPTESGPWILFHGLYYSIVVSNLYGSRQSRDEWQKVEHSWFMLFPIYMDPDRVGTACLLCLKVYRYKAFPIYMDPDRVGT